MSMISIWINDDADGDNVQKVLEIIHSVRWTLKIQDAYVVTRPLLMSGVMAKQLNLMIEPYGYTLSVYDRYGCSIKNIKTGRLLEHA